jgi:hypothetical protein
VSTQYLISIKCISRLYVSWFHSQRVWIMDGNHANSTNSHMTARLAQHRRGGDRNPYRNSIQHTAYSIQRDPRTFEFAAGMGMDGNHVNSTCTHQHLASQRNSIYSTISISTLHVQLLPCTWTLDATNMFEVLTQTQFKVFFALILYLQVPHLPDLGRHGMWGDGGTTIQQ